MNIKLLPRGDFVKTAVGLAGSSVNGSMVSRNGTKYSLNASEYDLFEFGESCKY